MLTQDPREEEGPKVFSQRDAIGHPARAEGKGDLRVLCQSLLCGAVSAINRVSKSQTACEIPDVLALLEQAIDFFSFEADSHRLPLV